VSSATENGLIPWYVYHLCIIKFYGPFFYYY
jgi:hypothetical protein